jgi:3-oxoacyl-[acyl-carrier protein] reductase
MKTVLVTGGTRGLGLAICRRLVTENYNVVMIGRQPSSDAATLLASQSKNLCFRKLDQLDIASVGEFVKSVHREFGGFYGLINNAAVGEDGVLATMSDNNIEQVIRVNVLSTIIITKYVSRFMLLAGEGRIVNIGSIVASTGFHGLSVYAATKAALVGFTKSLARELGRANITVNSISPGYMETDMTKTVTAKRLNTIRNRSPFKRLVLPEEVAGTVAYLLGAEAASISGIDLRIDAGSTA